MNLESVIIGLGQLFSYCNSEGSIHAYVWIGGKDWYQMDVDKSPELDPIVLRIRITIQRVSIQLSFTQDELDVGVYTIDLRLSPTSREK